MRRDLSAKLGADRTAAAGDEDCFALYVAEDRIHIDPDRLSSKKVFHFDVTQLRNADFAVDQLINSRQHLQPALGLLADVQKARELLP